MDIMEIFYFAGSNWFIWLLCFVSLSAGRIFSKRYEKSRWESYILLPVVIFVGATFASLLLKGVYLQIVRFDVEARYGYLYVSILTCGVPFLIGFLSRKKNVPRTPR